jgi:hypothetical protein
MYSTRYFCWILMRFQFSRQMFEKVPNIKFDQNPSSGSRVPCRQTDMAKLIVVLKRFRRVIMWVCSVSVEKGT